MRPVPVHYNPYADARWSNFRVSFRLLDTTAAADATPSVNQQEAHMTQLDQTHDDVAGLSAKWATFETGGCPCDGSARLVPDDVTGYQTGWWSGLSGADGTFATAPMLTFDFTANHSSVGFTVIFDDKTPQFPRSMTVTVYNSANTVIASRSVQVTGAMQAVDLPVENYRRVRLTFGATAKPYQRIRVSEVRFGIIQEYDRHNTTQISFREEISPTAEKLPSTELDLTFDNIGGGYNMANPSGLFAYIQEGQVLDAEIDTGGKDTQTSLFMGRINYTSSEASDASATARMTGNDPFLRLGDSLCRIGQTGTWGLDAAVAAILADSGRDIAVDIPAHIAARVIRRCIPQDTPHREAIRLAAQAARCTCWFDREGVLVFRELGLSTIVDSVSNHNMPSPAMPRVANRINRVELTVRDEYVTKPESVLYTASNAGPTEPIQAKPYNNPLVYDGPAVAAWLLTMAGQRLSFDLIERGNPARELGDTVTVTDTFGTVSQGVLVMQELIVDQKGLHGTGRAWRCE